MFRGLCRVKSQWLLHLGNENPLLGLRIAVLFVIVVDSLFDYVEIRLVKFTPVRFMQRGSKFKVLRILANLDFSAAGCRAEPRLDIQTRRILLAALPPKGAR